jgi:hypothetical protein
MKTLLVFMKEPSYPFVDNLCDVILTTTSTFPHAPHHPIPAEQRPDDKHRIMDQYACFDESLMRDYISPLEDSDRNFLIAQLDMAKRRLSAFPPEFRIWDTMPGHNLSVRGSYHCKQRYISFLTLPFFSKQERDTWTKK